MDCVACGAPMRKRPYEGVTIDECVECGSVWLDRGELGPILDSREVDFSTEQRALYFERLRSGVRRGDAAPRECPVCGVEMQVFNYGGNSGVFLDRCPNKHGLWLDPGELENIQIAMEGPPPEVSRDAGVMPNYDGESGLERTAPATQRRCPVCDVPLEEAELGDIPLDRCRRCGGVWCDGTELTKLFFTWQEASGEDRASVTAGRPERAGEEQAERELLCITCRMPLERFNFQYTSGIYVHNCPQGHGTWLDADKIGQLQAYARGLLESGIDDSRTRSLSEGELHGGRERTATPCRGTFAVFLQLFGLCTES